MLRTRFAAAIGGLAIVAAGLVGITAPASAVETITETPALGYDPAQTYTIRVDGFPAMTAGNYYVYWLSFLNLRGTSANARPSAYNGTAQGAQTGAQCTAQTGVTFATVSGPGTPAPNGDSYNRENGCSWIDGSTFKFVYSGATGLNNSSVIDITFPIGAFALPASGNYAVKFTAGANQEWALDTDCYGSCPLPSVTVPVDANGGTNCTVADYTGIEGSMATAPVGPPYGVACSDANKTLVKFTTAASGRGKSIAPGSRFMLESGMTLYAQWIEAVPPGPPGKPRVIADWHSVKVRWQAASGRGLTVSNYMAHATPNLRFCVTRLRDDDMLQCTIELRPGRDYTVVVQALNPAGWGEYSEPSDPVTPQDLQITSIKRTRVLLIGNASDLNVVTKADGFAPGKKLIPYFAFTSKRTAPTTWNEGEGRPKVAANGTATMSRKISRDQKDKWVWVRFGDGRGNFSEAKAIGPLK